MPQLSQRDNIAQLLIDKSTGVNCELYQCTRRQLKQSM